MSTKTEISFAPLTQKDRVILAAEARKIDRRYLGLLLGGTFIIHAVVVDYAVSDLIDYLEGFGLGLLISTLLIILPYIIALRPYNKDLREQTKTIGKITIAAKSAGESRRHRGNNRHFFQFELNGEQLRFPVRKLIYHRFREGDDIYFEIANHSKHLFRIEEIS